MKEVKPSTSYCKYHKTRGHRRPEMTYNLAGAFEKLNENPFVREPYADDMPPQDEDALISEEPPGYDAEYDRYDDIW